jgi:DNA gyrase subunit A
MVIAEPGATLLTVCEQGYGKRTDLDEYRSQSRGGVGLINIKTTDRNGKVVALKAVHDGDEVMIVTASGIIIRMGLEEVRAIGRNTAGVRMIRLNDPDKVVAVTRLASEEQGDPSASSDPVRDQDASSMSADSSQEDMPSDEEISDEENG